MQKRKQEGEGGFENGRRSMGKGGNGDGKERLLREDQEHRCAVRAGTESAAEDEGSDEDHDGQGSEKPCRKQVTRLPRRCAPRNDRGRASDEIAASLRSSQ